MTALLNLIYCWAVNLLGHIKELGLQSYDSLLGVADSVLSGIDPGALSTPVIPDAYAWILGVTGCSQALAIVAGAMLVRFLLQSVPFVRWGS